MLEDHLVSPSWRHDERILGYPCSRDVRTHWSYTRDDRTPEFPEETIDENWLRTDYNTLSPETKVRKLYFHIPLFPDLILNLILNRPLVKSAYQKINFLIFQLNYMLKLWIIKDLQFHADFLFVYLNLCQIDLHVSSSTNLAYMLVVLSEPRNTDFCRRTGGMKVGSTNRQRIIPHSLSVKQVGCLTVRIVNDQNYR